MRVVSKLSPIYRERIHQQIFSLQNLSTNILGPKSTLKGLTILRPHRISSTKWQATLWCRASAVSTCSSPRWSQTGFHKPPIHDFWQNWKQSKPIVQQHQFIMFCQISPSQLLTLFSLSLTSPTTSREKSRSKCKLCKKSICDVVIIHIVDLAYVQCVWSM